MKVAELCDKIKEFAVGLESANETVEAKMLILIAVEEILGSDTINYETPSLEPIEIDRSQVSMLFDEALSMDILILGEPKDGEFIDEEEYEE